MALHPAAGPSSHATQTPLQVTKPAVPYLVDIEFANVLLARGYPAVVTKPSLDVV